MVTLSLRIRQASLALVGLLIVVPGLAYDGEEPERPADGEVVGSRVEFFIHADGSLEPSDAYKIEVSDDEFETVLHAFDGARERKGWSFSAPLSIDEDPYEGFEDTFGIYLRVREPFTDGEYSWRAFKYDGTSYQPIGDEITFRVDTVPPATVTGMRAETREDGRVVLTWDSVVRDAEGNTESVAGYRVYRFTSRRRFFNIPTYQMAETETTRYVFDLPEEDDALIYYRVTAVDAVGNEEGLIVTGRGLSQTRRFGD